MQQSGCRALILASQFKTSNYTEMVQALAPELQRCAPGQLKAARLSALTTVIRIGSEQVAGMFNWGELMALGSSVSDEQLLEQQRQQEFDDPINIQYTSQIVRQISILTR